MRSASELKTNKEGSMKVKVILGLLFLTISLNVDAQQTEPQTTTQKSAAVIKKEKDDDSKSAVKTDQTYVRPDKKTRQKNYFKSIFGPYALGKTVVGAGISTARNSPEEWGGGWEGFGRRVASGFGKNAIKQTTIFTLDESFKLDSKFYRSQNRSFGSKVKNALISPFTARSESGKRVFGFPRIVGTYTSSIIAAETWYPKRYGYKNGLRSGTISLGLNAAFNLFKEFIKK
jgi:hypothetical protein